MKKLILCLTVIVIAVCSVACNVVTDNVEGSDIAVITVSSDVLEITSTTTLLDYMNELKSKGKISFSMADGMITEINGKSAGGNVYWMLYTDDAELSNEAWGTYEYQQKTYLSAIYGAESLVVKEGATYVWHLQAF